MGGNDNSFLALVRVTRTKIRDVAEKGMTNLSKERPVPEMLLKIKNSNYLNYDNNK